jgi:hypothetical protein
MGFQVSALYADFDSFRYMPGSGITGSNGKTIFSYFRNLNTDLHSGYTNIYSHQ